MTGFGMDGGDDPAFDYVIQAATGVAAMTGDPDGPPTLPGYSAADNSTGLAAALGLLAQIVSGRGGQVDVSLRDVVMSQLNYRASAYLNDGVEPHRHPFGAHSYYVPAQLFPTADGYLALFITHDAFWKSFAAEAGISGFPTMAERAAQREEVLAVVTAALATDSARGWEARLRPLGIPAAAVRTLPEALEATPEVVVTAGDFRLVGSPIHVSGYQPDYRPPPRLDEHPRTREHKSWRRSLVLDRHRRRVRHTLTGEDVPLGHFILVQRVVDPHGRLALGQSGHAGAAVARLATEWRGQAGAAGTLQQGLVLDAWHRSLLPVEQDRHGSLDVVAGIRNGRLGLVARHLTSPCAIEILLLREYYSLYRIGCSRRVSQRAGRRVS